MNCGTQCASSPFCAPCLRIATLAGIFAAVSSAIITYLTTTIGCVLQLVREVQTTR